MSESLKLYRAQLDAAYLKMVEEYDKAIMTLSGGGLGITFVFIKDFIGTNAVQRKQVLFWTWVCWGLSITFVILSFITTSAGKLRSVEKIRLADTRELDEVKKYPIFSPLTCVNSSSSKARNRTSATP
jgi:hypothetical protein